MTTFHLKHIGDLIGYVEMIAGKKLSDHQKTFLGDVLNNTYGEGYQRAANIAADVVYKDKFQLSAEHFDWFIQIHRHHMQAWETDNQKKYSLPNVKDVVYDPEDDCLKVYYDDTWWHYDRRGYWY